MVARIEENALSQVFICGQFSLIAMKKKGRIVRKAIVALCQDHTVPWEILPMRRSAVRRMLNLDRNSFIIRMVKDDAAEDNDDDNYPNYVTDDNLDSLSDDEDNSDSDDANDSDRNNEDRAKDDDGQQCDNNEKGEEEKEGQMRGPEPLKGRLKRRKFKRMHTKLREADVLLHLLRNVGGWDNMIVNIFSVAVVHSPGQRSRNPAPYA